MAKKQISDEILHDRFSKRVVMLIVKFLMAHTAMVHVELMVLSWMRFDTAGLIEFNNSVLVFFGAELLITAWASTKADGGTAVPVVSRVKDYLNRAKAPTGNGGASNG